MPQLPAATPVERALWLLLILIVLGYLGGVWYNRRISKATGLWLEKGVGSLGGTPSWRLVRSLNSGVEVSVSGASAPLRQAQIGFYLLTREFPPLMAFEMLRGKRDVLAIRADLSRTAAECEIVPDGGKLQAAVNASAGETPFLWQPLPGGLALGVREPAPARLVKAATTFAQRYGAVTQRVSLRQQRKPNLLAFFSLGRLESTPSADLLAAVRELVVAAGSKAGA